MSQPTLGDMLESILPEYFEREATDDGSIGETASVSSAEPKAKSTEVLFITFILAFVELL